MTGTVRVTKSKARQKEWEKNGACTILYRVDKWGGVKHWHEWSEGDSHGSSGEGSTAGSRPGSPEGSVLLVVIGDEEAKKWEVESRGLVQEPRRAGPCRLYADTQVLSDD